MSGIVGNNTNRGSGIVKAAVVGADAIDGSNIADDAIDSEHLADNAVGLSAMAGNTDGVIISFDASGDPIAIGPGSDGEVLTSTGAGSPPAFEEAAGGGDSRNFIIDGDFTQWPEGTTRTALANSKYGPALWIGGTAGTPGTFDVLRTADFPTVAQSKHISSYCCEVDVTTANPGHGNTDLWILGYNTTGSDFAYLHQQQVTLAFWVKATKTGTSCVYFTNSAYNRSYVAEFTISSSLTWEYKTVTLTLDSSGTWLFTEADVGLRIGFTIESGTDYDASAGSWQAGQFHSTTNQINHGDSASNTYRVAQVGLYLGSSAPTAFLGESVATVTDQVDWYVQDYDFSTESQQLVVHGHSRTTTIHDFDFFFRREMRAVPTITHGGTGNWAVEQGTTVTNESAIDWAAGVGESVYGCRIRATTGSIAAGEVFSLIKRSGSSDNEVLFDARH